MAAGLEESAGLITTQDLAAYTVLSREPVALRYRDYDILSNPLPSSGGTLIAFSLGLLDRVPLGGVDPVSLALSLAWALARTDQARDDLFNVGMREAGFADQFLSPATLDRYATPPPAEPQLRRPRPSAGGTTHISAIDSEGVAVALTSSCGSGSGVIIEGTGIIMNNMGGEEDLNPGGPFSLPPGERLTSMMAPTIARRADGGLLALGSAGSARLRSAIVQTLVNVIDRGFLASDAVNAPRLHVDRGTVQLEGGTPVEVARAAEDAGYPVNLWPVLDLYFGGVQIAARSESGSRSAFDGAGDPRRGGVALLA
jgi:gamma-glutamyltranspeptidase/glutathione hydrolase